MSSKFSEELGKVKDELKEPVSEDTIDFSKDEFFLKKKATANEILARSKKKLPNGMVLRKIEQ